MPTMGANDACDEADTEVERIEQTLEDLKEDAKRSLKQVEIL